MYILNNHSKQKVITFMKNRLKKYFNNLSLNKKLLIITTVVNTFLIASVNILGATTIFKSYNELLYQNVAASLSYSSVEIQEVLDSAMTMSNMMLADSTIQNKLTDLQDLSTSRINTYNALYNRVQSYYYEYRENNISHVNLMTNRFNIESYSSNSYLPVDIQNDIESQAIEGDGRAIWITNYGEDYGLFLTRLIRQIEKLSLTPLGILTINIDINSALKYSNAFNQYDDARYLLFKDNKLIYDSNTIDINTPDSLNLQLTSGYKLITLNHHRYFAVKGIIPNYEWDYIILVPYDSINHSIRLSFTMYLVILLLSILLSMLLSRLLLHSLTKHFGYLILRMQKYSQSKALVVDSMYDYSERHDEIGELHRQFHQMANEIQELIQVNYLNQILIKDAEIKALEMQINPHFLYNTLESINWRAKQVGEKQISQMVQSLGNLLRMTLSKKDISFTLKDEIQLVESYLTIQKIRFEERLEYEITTDEDLLNCILPKLTIQPLVENAINHALEEMIDTCIITVSITLHRNLVYIKVKNNGSQFEEDLLNKLKSKEHSPSGLGLALLNIDQRTKLAFGNEYGLSFKNQDDYAIVTLIIPYTH